MVRARLEIMARNVRRVAKTKVAWAVLGQAGSDATGLCPASRATWLRNWVRAGHTPQSTHCHAIPQEHGPKRDLPK